MGPPLLIGAGIGAISSAAMGKSPFVGALLGGATGGMLGGAGGIGSGFGLGEGGLLSGLKGALPSAAPSLGSGGYAALAPTASSALGGINIQPILNQAVNPIDDLALNSLDDIAFNTSLPTNVTGGAGINFKDIGTTFGGTNLPAGGAGINIAPYTNIPVDKLGEINPLTLDPRRIAVDTPLTLGERISDFGSNLGSDTLSYAKQNPSTVLGAGKSVLDIRQQAEAEQKQRLRDATALNQPIRRNQINPMAGNLLQVRRIG